MKTLIARSDPLLPDVHRSYRSLVSVQPAQGCTVNLRQVGSNVVATGSGAINLTGLTFFAPGVAEFSQMTANSGQITTGAAGVNVDLYRGFTGPTSFGSGSQFVANFGSGAFVGIFGSGFVGLIVPQGYQSNAALSSSSTWNNATFASLGVFTGAYAWTWGSGLPNQEFILEIGRAEAPDGGSTVSLSVLLYSGWLPCGTN